MAGTWLLTIALGYHPVAQHPWLSPLAEGRAATSPKCMARLPKAFRGGGQDELWEGAIWEGRVAEITVSGAMIICVRPPSMFDRHASPHVGLRTLAASSS
jgi:hypothetical protein